MINMLNRNTLKFEIIELSAVCTLEGFFFHFIAMISVE